MKIISVFYILFPLMLLIISGCAPLIVGGAVGAVGGYAVSRDTVQGDSDMPYEALWSSVLIVSKIRGKIKQQDYARGYVELEADSSQVWIRLVRLTQATTRIKVSARKYHLPNMALAQEIYTKIMEEAK